MWYQLQIEQCHRDEVEQLTEALEDNGALSISLTDKHDDPVLEPAPGTTPLWPDVVITALYTEPADAETAMLLLKAQSPHLNLSIQELADQDWERVWMDDFQPLCFGERLWVCPSWMEPPAPDAVNLILDPGLAFGTGTHPTTSLCLSWLDKADLAGKQVIDYGCGSGILALASLKLGAAGVQAVDIDEQALQATRNNAETNQISQESLTIGLPQILKTPVDLLIANILLAPLMALKSQFKALLKEGGVLVVSGILEEQSASLIEHYQDDFSHQFSKHHEGWSLLTFTRS